MQRFFRLALPLLLAAGAGLCHAQAPGPVTALLDALPTLPPTAEQAAHWVDKQGKLVHPGLLALQQAMEQHRQAVARISQEDAATAQVQGGYTTQGLMQGMADVGIDVQRLQTDPAYAQQVQDRLRRMTPAEQMAMAQRMSAPVNADRRIVNQAQAMAEDTPAARAAYEAGQAYTQGQVERITRHQAAWQESEAAVQRVLTKPLNPGLPKPAMEWDNIGCLAACQAQWEAYAARMLPLMIARDTEVLRLRSATVLRMRAAALPDLQKADRHLQATGFGAQSRSSVHRGQIVAYDSAAVAEVQWLWDRVAESARQAVSTVHCGKQIVLVPRAVCQ